LWKKNVEDRKYNCFETLETFIIENEVKPAGGVISTISAHLNSLKEHFDCNLLEEMGNCQQKKWTAKLFQRDMTTGISRRTDEELVDLSEDTSLKINFNRKKIDSSGCLFNKRIQLFLQTL
jgi:hypothetical protein